MKALHISARRWFDSQWGNTYFSAKAYVDGKCVDTIDFEYGYGDQCIAESWHNVKTILGIDEKLCTFPSMYCRENGIIYTSDIADVQRKRDLKQ